MRKLAVIIPTFNRSKKLEKLLKQLLCQDFPEAIQINIIVVIDGSTDDTASMIERIDQANLYVVHGNGDWWFTQSLNEGILKAKSLESDLIMFFNDDLEVPSDFIVKMLHTYRNQGEDSLIGPLQFSNKNKQQVFGSGIKQIIWWRFKYIPYIKKFSTVNRNDLKGVYPAYLLTTRGMLTSMNVINELRGFDSKFVQYGSDDDFCLRAQKKGYGIFLTMDTELYVNIDMTSKGSSNVKSTLQEFIASFSNPYSANSISFLKLTLQRHSTFKPWLIPLTISIMGRVRNFIKRNYL